MHTETEVCAPCHARRAPLGDAHTIGQPLLLFPTAGGDCEEVERWHMIDVLRPLIDAGAIKVYSCDSVAGQALLTMYVDITARKSAEAALRRSEALLSHLFATSPDCLTLTDLETGRYALVNDCFLQVTGWRREEVIGRTSTELGIWQRPEDRDVFVAAIRRQGGVQAMPVNFRHREGRRIPLLASGARFDFDGQRFLVLAARDVSASEQTRLEVEAILNTVSLAIAFVREQRIVRVNARHREMFGYSEEELRQSTLSALWPDPAGFQRLRREAFAADGVDTLSFDLKGHGDPFSISDNLPTLPSLVFTTGQTDIDVAVNGVPIYDYSSQGALDPSVYDPKFDTKATGELDVCNGHSGRGDDYHYHAAPTCMMAAMKNAGPRAILGWGFDGYPIYGNTNPDGTPRPAYVALAAARTPRARSARSTRRRSRR